MYILADFYWATLFISSHNHQHSFLLATYSLLYSPNSTKHWKMKTFAISATLVVLATSVVADNCIGGLSYCSSSLLQKGTKTLTNICMMSGNKGWLQNAIGNYAAQINQALALAHQTNPQDADKALFFCEGGSNGNIVFTTSCANGCEDGGAGNTDYCAAWAFVLVWTFWMFVWCRSKKGAKEFWIWARDEGNG